MIVIEQIPNIRLMGLASALQACHSDVKFWNSTTKPFFDMVYELSPQLIIMNSVKEEYLSSFYKLVSLNPSEYTQSIDISKNLADVIQFGNGVFNEQIKTRILYISNQPINDQNLYQFLLRLEDTTQLKIVGSYPFPSVGYVGNVNLGELNDFMASSEYTICYNNELMMECILNGSKPIATYANELGIPTIHEINNWFNIVYPQLNIDPFTNTYLHIAHSLEFAFDKIQPLILLEQIKYDKIRNNI